MLQIQHLIIKQHGILIIDVIDEKLVKSNDPKYVKYLNNFKEMKTCKTKNFYDKNDEEYSNISRFFIMIK